MDALISKRWRLQSGWFSFCFCRSFLSCARNCATVGPVSCEPLKIERRVPFPSEGGVFEAAVSKPVIVDSIFEVGFFAACPSGEMIPLGLGLGLGLGSLPHVLQER